MTTNQDKVIADQLPAAIIATGGRKPAPQRLSRPQLTPGRCAVGLLAMSRPLTRTAQAIAAPTLRSFQAIT